MNTMTEQVNDILEGWKTIADYMQRSEKTVRIWREKHGLPVFKFQGRVVARRSALDMWRQTRLIPAGWTPLN